jgi:hypothetical protein
MSDLQIRVAPPPQVSPQDEIIIGKTVVVAASGHGAEVFTMTLGAETIRLLPLRNWSQLDLYKWRARGKVPGTPAGLEITFDHVKVGGEAVSIYDPEGSAKLQKLLNQWLIFERGSVDRARQKEHVKQASPEPQASLRSEPLTPRFCVEVDKEGQVHIKCLQGKETLALIGLNLPGLNNLVSQGVMHKPHSLQVGALHDWVELDGQFFSFEHGNNDASKLEKVLNERYLSTVALGQGKEVVVFPNAASPTGFDIQFAAKVGGVVQHHRHPLNEETLALLQDRDRCGLLPKDLVIKLSPPNFIFKLKTPDGGERYLDEGPEHIVKVVGDEGEVRMIDLSRPVSYLRLNSVELTAVFNHPAINQHATVSSQSDGTSERPKAVQVAVPPAAARPNPPSMPALQPKAETKPVELPALKPETSAKPVVLRSGGEPAIPSAPVARPPPNAWLKGLLVGPLTRPDWFAWVVYRKLAEHFGNSREGYFGPIPCWACSLGEVEDICDPGFNGIFLTQKGGLGYLNQGRIIRFHKGVAFVGTLESAIEGIGVHLEAVATDVQRHIVFIVNEGYRSQFGVPAQTVAEELARLKKHGALVMSESEVLQSSEPIEVVWTVPAEQESPDDPQAMEGLRPAV